MTFHNNIADKFIIDNLETLKVVAHSLRLEILQTLRKAKSVKEIAEQINRPATKLYYHVNLMEAHGLIRVVETNIVSGIVEKTYQVVANNYALQDGLLAKSDALGDDIDQMLGAIFDVTRAEIKRSIEAKQMKPAQEDRRGILSRSTLRLTAVQFAEFYARFDDLLKEMETASHNNGRTDTAVAQRLFGATVAFYPIPQPAAEEEA